MISLSKSNLLEEVTELLRFLGKSLDDFENYAIASSFPCSAKNV